MKARPISRIYCPLSELWISLGFAQGSFRTSEFLSPLFCARFYFADTAGVDFELSLGANCSSLQTCAYPRAVKRLVYHPGTFGNANRGRLQFVRSGRGMDSTGATKLER